MKEEVHRVQCNSVTAGCLGGSHRLVAAILWVSHKDSNSKVIHETLLFSMLTYWIYLPLRSLKLGKVWNKEWGMQ